MIPNTGPITATMIKGEWGLSGSFAVWADGAALINKTSKPISYSDFRGKSNTPADTPAIGEGGNTSTSNGYKHHVFTNAGEFCIKTAPTGGLASKKIETLVVGGGAGGGGGGEYGSMKSEMGGGGGAGGMVAQSGFVPTTVACHSVSVGGGGSGGTSYPSLGRGVAGVMSFIMINKNYNTATYAYGGGGGGAIIYGGNFGGLDGASGGGGGGKANHSRDLRWTSDAGKGTQGNNGGVGGYGAGGGGGTRAAGNAGGGQKGGSGGGGSKYTVYDNGEYSVGGGGAGGSAGGGSGYGISGSGGSQPYTGSQSSPSRPGCGGGGGGSISGGRGQPGTSGYRGVVIISIPQS